MRNDSDELIWGGDNSYLSDSSLLLHCPFDSLRASAQNDIEVRALTLPTSIFITMTALFPFVFMAVL